MTPCLAHIGRRRPRVAATDSTRMTLAGLVYPPRGIDLRSKKKRESFSVDWKDKLPTAVFRGNSTGGGVTPETNQRLHLALLSQQWEKDPNLNDDNPVCVALPHGGQGAKGAVACSVWALWLTAHAMVRRCPPRFARRSTVSGTWTPGWCSGTFETRRFRARP